MNKKLFTGDTPEKLTENIFNEYKYSYNEYISDGKYVNRTLKELLEKASEELIILSTQDEYNCLVDTLYLVLKGTIDKADLPWQIANVLNIEPPENVSIKESKAGHILGLFVNKLTSADFISFITMPKINAYVNQAYAKDFIDTLVFKVQVDVASLIPPTSEIFGLRDEIKSYLIHTISKAADLDITNFKSKDAKVSMIVLASTLPEQDLKQVMPILMPLFKKIDKYKESNKISTYAYMSMEQMLTNMAIRVYGRESFERKINTARALGCIDDITFWQEHPQINTIDLPEL